MRMGSLFMLMQQIFAQSYIMSKQLLLLLVLALTAFAKVSFHQTLHTPANQQQYAQYLSIMLGKHSENSQLSPALQELIKTHRPSIMNAVQQVVMILAPSAQPVQDHAHHFTGQKVSPLVSDHQQHFTVKLLDSHDEQELRQEVEKHQGEGRLVEVIRGQAKELERITAHLEQARMRSEPRKLHERVAIADGSKDSTYLFKFFFAILMVIVSIGCVGFIIDSDSKKDTLLYAKFIADVSNIR